MSSTQYYSDHRALTAHRRARPPSLDGNRARALPTVPPKTQAAWLAQLARLDDPHTSSLALAYLEQKTMVELLPAQIPAFVAVFSQSTDSRTRRQCARLGALEVFAAICRSVKQSDLHPHAGRVAGAVALYCGDPDEAVRRACGRAAAAIAAHTEMSLAGAVSAPFLSLLKSTPRWQAQHGACECLRSSILEATARLRQRQQHSAGSPSRASAVALDAVDVARATQKIVAAARAALKRVHAKAKPGLYAVVIACLRASVVAGDVPSSKTGSDANGHSIDAVALSGLLCSIADDLRRSGTRGNGGTWDGDWRSRQAAAVALGEIVMRLEQPSPKDCENARHALENILFDKVPGVRSAAQAVLSLRVLGGNLEQVPPFDASGSQSHKYGRVGGIGGINIKGGLNRNKPPFGGRRHGSTGHRGRSPSPERQVAEATVDMAMQQAFEKFPEAMPKPVQHVHPLQSGRRGPQENPEDPSPSDPLAGGRTEATPPPPTKRKGNLRRKCYQSNSKQKKDRGKELNKRGRSRRVVKEERSTENISSSTSALADTDSSPPASSSSSSRSVSPSGVLREQVVALRNQQAVFSRELSSIRDEMQSAMATMTRQMGKLERMVGALAEQVNTPGNRITVRGEAASTFVQGHGRSAASPWLSRPRRTIEDARVLAGVGRGFSRSSDGDDRGGGGGYDRQQLGTGHAQLVLETALAGAEDDGGLMRQCNAAGPACLRTLSLSTQKRLFVRLVGMIERNNFVLQALPWFQAAMNLDLLPRVLSTPGMYSRAVQCFQSMSRAGGSSALALDAHQLCVHLTSLQQLPTRR